MRVTENRMMELSATAVASARDRVARASSQLSSGERVSLPSDDPTAWAQGLRADARAIASHSRGRTIGQALDDLAADDGALSTIGDLLRTALERAVQLGNGTYSATERAVAAKEI